MEATLYCDELADTIFNHDYCMDQIFNTDETCLNYKILPSKTLAAKANRDSYGKEVLEMCDCYNMCYCIRHISITLISYYERSVFSI